MKTSTRTRLHSSLVEIFWKLVNRVVGIVGILCDVQCLTVCFVCLLGCVCVYVCVQ